MTINHTVSVSSATSSAPIRLDSANANFVANVTIFDANSNTSKLQYTLDKPDLSNGADNWASATWVDDTTLTGITATTTGRVDTPVEAVRLTCTSYSTGTISMQVIQGDKT